MKCFPGAGMQDLFVVHATRFGGGAPGRLLDFLSPDPDSSPCETLAIEARVGGRLVAASFIDVGERAASSVYAIFDPGFTWKGKFNSANPAKPDSSCLWRMTQMAETKATALVRAWAVFAGWTGMRPLGIFGTRRTGAVRAWAMNYRKQRLYRLDGDHDFLAIYPLDGQTAPAAPPPAPLHPPINQ